MKYLLSILDEYVIKTFYRKNETTIKIFENRVEFMTVESLFMDSFWVACDYPGVLNVFKYLEEKVILEKYTLSCRKKSVLSTTDFNFLLEVFIEDGKVKGGRIDLVYNDIRGALYSGIDEMVGYNRI